MKKMKGLFIAIAIAAVAVGGAVIIKNVVGGHGQHGASQSTLYHCPMHPTYTSDRPGDCPICGMKLVEVEQEEHAASQHEAVISMPEGSHAAHGEHGTHADQEGDQVTPEQKSKSLCLFHECPMLKEGKICPMLIFTEDGKSPECPVCKQKLTGKEIVPVDQPKDIMGYTAVTLSSKKQQLIGIRTAPVTAQKAAKVIRTVGKIAYDPELYQAEEEFLQAIEAYEKAAGGAPAEITARAERLVEATRTKLELLGLSEDLVEEVKTSGVPDRSLILAKPGGTVWMYAPIYEQELDIIRPGQKVSVTAQNIVSGKKFSGTVRSIDPVLDPQTRSVRIRAVLDNSEGYLKPNVYVNAEIEVDLGKQILIPESSVLDSGERKIAFVALGNGVFEPRLLTLGPKLEDTFIVVSGVSENEEVVAQAAFFVDSESRLKAAIGQMAGGGGHAGHGG